MMCAFLSQEQPYRDVTIDAVCQRSLKNTFTELIVKHMQAKRYLGKHFRGGQLWALYE